MRKTNLDSQRWLSGCQSSEKFKEEKKVHTATKLKLHLGSKSSGGGRTKHIDVNPCIVHEKQEEAAAIKGLRAIFKIIL